MKSFTIPIFMLLLTSWTLSTDIMMQSTDQHIKKRTVTPHKNGKREIIYYKSEKKEFIFYNKENKITSRIIINQDGSKALTTKDPAPPENKVAETYIPHGFKKSHTVTHTYFPDGFKKSDHDNGMITEKAPHQNPVCETQITFQIAYHEAAHTLAQTLKYGLYRPVKVTRAPEDNQRSKNRNMISGGYAKTERTYFTHFTNLQLKNRLISALSGGVGEQIFNNEKIYTTTSDIKKYYEQIEFTGDMVLARQVGLLLLQFNYNKQFHTLLAETYKETYLFQLKYKKYLRKLAHALVKKPTLTQDEIYKIVDIAAKPLKFGEIGPLEKQFEDDYQYREIVMNKIKKQKEKIPQTSVVHDGQVKKSPFAQDNILPKPAFKPNFRYRY